GVTGNGSYTWTIPNNPSVNCLVRVEDYNNTCRYDNSDAVFTIQAPTPYITVTYPNGGQTLYSYNTANITWTSGYLSSSFVRIDYSADNGATWVNVIASTNNSGTYTWTIPNITTTQALVRVMDYGNSATYDVSNAVFTINPGVVVTAPNGGENLNGCTVTTIAWTGEPGTNSYTLQYSTNGGTTWNTIVNQSFAGGPNYSYNWTLPNTASNFCLVQVYNSGNASKTDQSNAVFNIVPAIVVTNPNNGGSYAVGSTLNITWTSVGVSNFYNIDYSTNGGATWTNIVFNTNILTNSYSWTVPNSPSVSCYVRVTDYNAACKTDQSDALFTITNSPASITVTSPNGGENWVVCSTHNITWSANATSGNYDIDYSSNNGVTWNVVIANYATVNGTYAWTTPSTPTVQGLIRVKDSGNGALVDQSNAVFTISNLATPGVISGNTPVCESSSQTYSIALVTGATSYAWILPSGWSGTSTSNIINVVVGSASGTITVTANNSCYTTAASTKTVTATPLPVTPGAISGNITPCTGIAVTYSITAVSGATSYTWLLPIGYTGSSTTNSISVTIGSNPGTIQVYANNSCGSSAASSLTVTPTGGSLPAQPASISGPASPCASTAQTYSVSPVAGATFYTWTLPGTWTGTSTTNTISVTAGTAGGTISVSAGNTCGSSSVQTLAVSISNVPAQPGVISGNTTVCLGSANTYSITAVGGATGYTWTLPGGWTGTSTTNSISTTAGATGTITVTADNACGSSTPRTLAVTVNTVPAQPGAISGNTTVCLGTANTYSISAVSGATSYSWTLPGGWTGSSTTNSISTTAGASSGTITVTANNTCGSGTAQTLAVTVNSIPAQPGAISGNTTICGSTAQTYSVTSVSGATSYAWTLPGGWTGSSTTNSINTTAGNTSGNVTVTASNTCGTSPVRTLSVTVNPVPAQPASISGNTTICGGTTNTYSITPVSGATAYTWTLPGGWTGTSTSNSISATANNASGTITVTADNACGSSPTQSLAITVLSIPVQPGAISGNTTVCQGTANTYSISAVSGATNYSWTLPGGWTGSSVTNSITTTVGATGGTISVSAANSCGSSSAATLTVTVNPLPAIPTITASGPTTFCSGGSVDLTSSVENSYNWSPTSATTQSVTVTSSGNYAVTVTDVNGCTATSATTAVTVNGIPSLTVTASALMICAGNSTSLTASGASTYVWLPSGDLNNANISNPIATPSANTTYTVTGTTNGCSGTSTVSITVNPIPPTPTVTVSGTTTFCSSGSVDLTSSAANSYSWTPTSATTQSITVTSSGNYAVTIIDANGCTATSASTNVTVNSLPSSTITPSGPTTFCQGGSVTLSSPSSTGNVWSTTATTQTISVSTSGTYSLTVTDVNSCSSTSSINVTVNPLPTVTASANLTTICAGSSTTLSASGATTYVWSPSTGLSSTTGANVTATPTATITYTVAGTNGNNCTSTDAVTINVTPGPAIPTITANGPTTFCAGGSVDLTSSAATTYSWTPTSATTQSITVTSSGSYVVTVTDAIGCSSSSAPTTVTVNALPTITATASAYTICAGNSTSLNASGASTYVWSPSGSLNNANIANPIATPSANTTYTVTGTTNGCSGTAVVSITVNPVPATPTITPSGMNLVSSSATGNQWYLNGTPIGGATNQIYTPTQNGNYTVVVTNAFGCTAISSVYVYTSIAPIPVANFVANTTTVTVGGSVNFTDLSTNNPTNWSWIFTGGTPATSTAQNPTNIVYSTVGCYSVTLTATNASGSDAEIKSCYINVIATPTYCIPSPTNGTTYDDFIDGVVLGTINNTGSGSTGGPSYTNYSSTMSTNVNKSSSYTISITGGLYQPDYYAAWIDYNKDGDFLDAGEKLGEFVTTAAYQTLPINFTVPAAASTGSTRLRVRCVYNAPGMDACTNYTYGETEDYKVVIFAAGNPPVANFSASSTNFCVNTCINFTDLSTNSPTSWIWSFAGASPSGSTSQNPTNICYNIPGTYSVTLTATNAVGSNSLTQTSYITVTAMPVANAGTDASICQGNSTTLSASGGSSYLWSPSTGLSATNIANPVASPTTTITYTVTVSNGPCSSTDQLTVFVSPPPSANAGSDVSICSGGNTTLNASGGGNYLWSPSTGLSATNIANPIASPTVTTTYTVTVSSGSCSASDIVVVTVNNVPAQPGIISGNFIACAGANETYTITPVSGATSYTWTLPGGWTGSSTTNSITATAGATGGTITVVANNSCGSSTVQSLSVIVTSSAPLQPGAIAGTDSVCSGSVQTYSVVNDPNASSYTWTLPGGWSGTSATNSISSTVGISGGTISVIANNSCGSSTAQTFSVTVNALPAVTFNLSPSIVCLNSGAFALTGGSPSGGTYSGTGVSAGNFTPATAGTGTFTITYSYTDVNGCTNTATQSIIVDPCTGIQNIVGEEQIIIYPNPFSENVTITWNLHGNHIVELFDVLGNHLGKWNITDNHLLIDAGNLEEGVYYIRTSSDSGMSVRKVVKLK
ncbi:MAG: PKD domain-containing protein, partial [Bacteroidetes bacterium]|nr:PKD domain-containing protein [Bacteroidota bacterium]